MVASIAQPQLAFLHLAEAPRPPDPDADILELVAAGKRDEALRLLMHRHGRSVYRFCSAALRNEARAEDVHQRVFIEAHRDLGSFAAQSRLKTWLFTIARHRVLDDAKAEQRRRHREEYEDTRDLADPSPDPGEQLDDARLREALVACLAQVSDDVRAAILLRFQQGLSFEEMAGICGEKAGTLQARVARAMEKLQVAIVKRLGCPP